jgi:hypothetical protein
MHGQALQQGRWAAQSARTIHGRVRQLTPHTFLLVPQSCRGDDWVGVDGSGTPWQCRTGLKQSPIYIDPQSGEWPPHGPWCCLRRRILTWARACSVHTPQLEVWLM